MARVIFADLPKTNLTGVLPPPAPPPPQGGVRLRNAPLLLPPIDGGGAAAAGGAPNGEKDDGAVVALPNMGVEEAVVVSPHPPPPPKNDGFGGESSGGGPPNVNGGITRVRWSPDFVSTTFIGSAFAASSTSSLPVPRGFANRSLRASALAVSEFTTATIEVDDDSLGLLLLSSCSVICFSDSIFLANAAAFRFFNLH